MYQTLCVSSYTYIYYDLACIVTVLIVYLAVYTFVHGLDTVVMRRMVWATHPSQKSSIALCGLLWAVSVDFYFVMYCWVGVSIIWCSSSRMSTRVSRVACVCSRMCVMRDVCVRVTCVTCVMRVMRARVQSTFRGHIVH